jgi:hypothetical protein
MRARRRIIRISEEPPAARSLRGFRLRRAVVRLGCSLLPTVGRTRRAGVAGDPGSFNDLNGALVEFDNAYNVELYSLLGGAFDTNAADYIQNNALDHALGLATASDAASYLFNFGLGDLEGYLGIFPSI